MVAGMKKAKLIFRGLLLWYFPTDREYRIMRRWKRFFDGIANAAWSILLGMASVSETKRRLAARRRGGRSPQKNRTPDRMKYGAGV